MESDRFDYLFKFLIIGNAGTGKTCILRRYTERKFFPNTQHTIGAEFGSRVISVDGTHVKIQIWDTAGQERFRSMARSYYHDAVGTLLVYDITNRTSFGAVEQWLGDARHLATPGVVVILVGNKKDLQDTDGQVTHWEANTFAQENGLQFIETSALTGENIDDAFTSCVRVLLSKVKSGELGADRLLVGSNKQHLQAVNLTASATSVSASQSSAATAHSDTCLC
ncbi:ras protein Rab 4A [Echinococcus multilocularis]|uniref:Ras protein Rab 4A n=1 Tax=Echinococcus multilocularis TaxID=6211 RepID=A0A068YJA4_ECHMU|nr:ras protein Rab 4A [Echinococcus multilocularis]